MNPSFVLQPENVGLFKYIVRRRKNDKYVLPFGTLFTYFTP